MQLFSFIKIMFSTFPKRVPAILFLMLFSGLTESLGLGMMVPIIEFFFDERSFEGKSFISQQFIAVITFFKIKPDLVVLFGLFILLFFLKSVVKFVESILIYQLIKYYSNQLATSIYKSITQIQWQFFQSKKHGYYSSLFVNEMISSISLYSVTLLFISESILLLFYLILSMIISLKLTLFVLIFLFFSYLFFSLLYGYSRKIGVEFQKTRNTFTASTNDYINILKWVKSAGKDKFLANVFEQDLHQWTQSQYKFNIFKSLIPSFFLFFSAIGLSGICYISLVIFHIKFSTVLLLLAIFYRALPKFQTIQQSYQGFLLYFPNLDVINSFIQKSDVNKESQGSKQFKSLSNSIELKNVSFSYTTKSNFSLSNLSLSFNKNTFTALVGPSGSGKSTLIDLVIGLLSPSKGDILVNNLPLRDYDNVSYRQKIGVVSQDILLLNDTIKTNLTWGITSVSKQRLNTILKQTHCVEFIDNMKDGLDTIIGDRGAKLSGGQRQRLCFARALLQKPDILILDEATSALDPESEEFIKDTIHQLKGSLTIIMISHRLASVKKADRIIVLDKGKIIEEGTWKQLSEKKGKFSLFKSLQLLD